MQKSIPAMPILLTVISRAFSLNVHPGGGGGISQPWGVWQSRDFHFLFIGNTCSGIIIAGSQSTKGTSKASLNIFGLANAEHLPLLKLCSWLMVFQTELAIFADPELLLFVRACFLWFPDLLLNAKTSKLGEYVLRHIFFGTIPHPYKNKNKVRYLSGLHTII